MEYSTYSLRQSGDVIVREWEGEDVAVVYCASSGDTHLISDVALSVLDRLDTVPLPVERIVDGLFETGPDGDLPSLISTVEQVLVQLVDIGLVLGSSR